MTAKEIQNEFIKVYLKPTLKGRGYQTKGNNWWKDQGDFFITLNLQNFSWNTKYDVTFCFNTGIAFKEIIKKRGCAYPNQHNSSIYLRSPFYLPEGRQEHIYQNKNGYILKDNVNLIFFINEFKSDFEGYVFPLMEKLKTVNDCVTYFENVSFWGDSLKRIVKDNGL